MDFYRFPGALLVLFGHYTVIYFPLSLATRELIYHSLESVLGLFFTVSGFVIMHVYDGRIRSAADYLDYMQKRLARIYPLFFVTFLAACVWGLCTTTRPGMFAPSAALPNLLMLHAWGTTSQLTFDYPSWSVSAEMFVYLLFPVFLMAMNRMKGAALLLPFLLGALVAAIFAHFDLGDWRSATFNFGCLRAVPSFVGGMVAHRLVTGPLAHWRAPRALAHLMGAATLPLMFLLPGELMLVYFVVLTIMLSAAEPTQPGPLSRPWARAVANASYGIYLIHALIGPILLGALVRVLHGSALAVVALTPVAGAVTIGLALLSFFYFEDPARRYLGRLGHTRGSAKAPRSARVAA